MPLSVRLLSLLSLSVGTPRALPSLSLFFTPALSTAPRSPLPHPFPLGSSLFHLSLRESSSLLLYRTPSYSPSPFLFRSSSSSFCFFSFSFAGYSLFFFFSHVRARESTRVRNVFLSLSPALSVRQGTVKRQLTIGAIHGLLARINCRRKLLRLCRVRVESSRESERTRARHRAGEMLFFFFTTARGITIHSASPHFHGEH